MYVYLICPKIDTLRGWSCEQRLEFYYEYIQALRNDLKLNAKKNAKIIPREKENQLLRGNDHFPLTKGK